MTDLYTAAESSHDNLSADFSTNDLSSDMGVDVSTLAHAEDSHADAPVAIATEAAETAKAAPAQPNGFALMGLAAPLLQAVQELGFTQPTAVQSKTIPLAMQAKMADGKADKAQKFIDLMVSSQTGSGKTAAFLLPVLHTLLAMQEQAEVDAKEEFERLTAEAMARGEAAPKRPKRKDPTSARNFKPAEPGALILCPTRELAQQVAADAIDLVRHCRGLRIANVVGGMPYQLQIARLQNANLVVATPGRLLDLQRSMQIKLEHVQFLVVDEADRMLDLGFADDLAEVNRLTIERKQTMMFSATIAPRIQQLATRVMRTPQRVTIDTPQEKHQNIKQVMFWADNFDHKRKLLDHWLRDSSINQAIVFASTQIECDGLANDLQQEGFDAVALHGALSQGLRNRRLDALRFGHVQILVATDVAARGIDVPTVTHVFNFGLPMKAEDYTHRIGRTGRAGRDGLAVTFAEFRDRRRVMDIEQFNRQPIKADVIPGLEPKARMPQARPFSDRRPAFGDKKPFGQRAPEGRFQNDGPASAPRSYKNATNFNSFGPDAAPKGPRGGFGKPAGGRFEGRVEPRGDVRFEGRNDIPRGDSRSENRFEGRPAGGAKPFKAPGPKVFVPRDAAKKRAARAA